MELIEICKQAKEIKTQIAALSTSQKNDALLAAADHLILQQEKLIAANDIDMENGRKNKMAEGLLDRLKLNKERIGQMAEGLRQIAKLDDPIGEVLSMKKRPNELMIGKKRVPLGVIGIIYESRPNVTADAFGLCFKTGNVVILRGGKDAIHSNQAIVTCIREALEGQNLPGETISFISDTSHETAREFMHMNRYVDVLIPRGGAGLIRTVVENATIPASVPKAHVIPAEEEDWGTEYLDYKISAKTVDSLEEAIAHINRYNTGHSDAIITNNYANAEKFLNEVDAAAVYVNASTRFTDGFEFGFGAEIGISTQKLHARGPMGLEALTSTKYIIYGNGQVRP